MMCERLNGPLVNPETFGPFRPQACEGWGAKKAQDYAPC